MRLSIFLRDKFPQLPSHKSVKKAIAKNKIFVNGIQGKTGDWVKEGDTISLTPSPPRNPEEWNSKEIPTITVLYEDEYLAIVVKSAGLATSGSKKSNLASKLPLVLRASQEMDALPQPLPAHRLDRDTEGILIVGKTWAAMDRLGIMLSEHKISKHYLAVGAGLFCGKFKVIQTPIESLNAETEIVDFHHLPTKHPTTLFKLALMTGRTHQIRIHLKSIGHPIVGDNKYNKDGVSFKTGLMLAAVRLEFHHPFIDEIVTVVWQGSKKFSKYSRFLGF